MCINAPVWADQCLLLREADARAAVATIQIGDTIREFCEPCNDPAPGKPFIVHTVIARHATEAEGDPSGWVIEINDKSYDLAYLFMQSKTDPTRYENVAKRANCETQLVSAAITVLQSADGVPQISTANLPSPLPAKVLFEADGAEISPVANETLQQIGKWLIAHPDTSASIEGHASNDEPTSDPSLEGAIALGQKRATSAARFLIELGVPRKQLDTISYANARPIVPGSGPAAERQNRVVMILLKSQ
jgi:outer membrane protein OmpA-like peptidoglycan-associated protein